MLHNTSAATRLDAPTIERPVAPAAVRYAPTREELRQALLPELIAGRASWISMDGLDITHTQRHARLLRTAALFRPAPARPFEVPHTAVLDWSTTRSTTVAAIAQFAVLVPWLMDQGAEVVCVEPSQSDVARCLEQGALEHTLGFRWVDSRPDLSSALVGGRFTLISGSSGNTSAAWRRSEAIGLLASPLVLDFRGGAANQRVNKEQAGAASLVIADAAVSRGWDEEVGNIFGALFLEIVGNALQHSSGNWTSAVFGIVHGPRPHLEFAVADDGIGIGASMLQRFSGLGVQRIPERALLAALFKDPDGDGRPGIVGRGATLLMRDFDSRAPGARIDIRSGGASLHLSHGLIRAGIASRANHGLGTVITCCAPVPPRG